MNPDGSDLKRLTNAPGSDGPARWSPDGTKIVFASDRDGNFEIYTMNADGSGQTRLTNDPALDSLPSWSPDGTKIAFTHLPQGGTSPHIFVMNADGSGQTQITSGAGQPAEGGGYFHANWGPDGRIAVSAFTPGTVFQIYVLNADGSGQRQITNDASSALTPGLVPRRDADRIPQPEQPVRHHPCGQSRRHRRRATHGGAAQDGLGAYSPDGTKIVFTSNRDGGPNQLYP